MCQSQDNPEFVSIKNIRSGEGKYYSNTTCLHDHSNKNDLL